MTLTDITSALSRAGIDWHHRSATLVVAEVGHDQLTIEREGDDAYRWRLMARSGGEECGRITTAADVMSMLELLIDEE